MRTLKQVLFLVFTFAFLALNAQNYNDKSSNISYRRLEIQNNQYDGEILKSSLNISKENSIKVIKESKTDDIIHTKYQQFAKGYEIEGAEFFAHKRLSLPLEIDGKWLEGFNQKVDVALSEDEAIEKGISSCGKKSKFYWEVRGLEEQLKMVKGEGSTYFPKADLVWYDKNYSTNAKNYSLVYKMDIFVYSPRAKYRVYVDASTGRIIDKYNTLENINVPGKGTTVYNGKVDITVDSLSPNSYVLHEEKRGGHSNISTFDASNSESLSLISDENNIWGEANEIDDRSGVEAHWSVELSLDFFDKYFNRKGYDNNGADVIVNVHAKQDGQPMANASWDGVSLNFGDGNAQFPHSFALLTIAAHEFTHAVTQNEANLIYVGESGAINEAMSDIFAITIEYYMNDGKYNWQMAEELGNPIRDMSNPKSVQMPSTYKGEFWEDIDVHITSAIGNLWYYYLVEGGSGLNDIGNNFEVKGIGFDKASKIAYACLTNYLTKTSDYADFRKQSIQAAIDMFGICSQEYLSVAEAWYAVGVGEGLHNNDLTINKMISPYSACRLGDETVAVELSYISCKDSLPANTEISIYYSVNSKDTVKESFVIDSTLYGGDSFVHVFSTDADLNNEGKYDVKVWFDWESDGFRPDDVLNLSIENRKNQNTDLEVRSVVVPENLHCDNSFDEIKATLVFQGCDSLAKGTKIPLELHIGENSIVYREYVLENTLFYEDSIVITQSGYFTLDEYGKNKIIVEAVFPNDEEGDNNKANAYVTFNKTFADEQAFKFDDVSDIEDLNITKGKYLRAYDDSPLHLVKRADDDTNNSMLITGGFGFDPENGFAPLWEEPESADKVWEVNNDFVTKACMCIDATEWDSVFLKFDLRMVSEDFFYQQFNLSPELYCNFRVLVDGEPVSSTYHVDVNDASYRTESFDLSEYAGSSFELCFEGQTIFERTSDDDTGIVLQGDDIELDNILISKEVNYTSVDDNLPQSMQLSAYPNPANNVLNVIYTNSSEGKVSYRLTGVNGNTTILSGDIESKRGDNLIKLDISGVNQGMYFLQILTKDRSDLIPVSIINQ